MAQKSIEGRIADARNAAELSILKRIKRVADREDLSSDDENLANLTGAYLRFAEAKATLTEVACDAEIIRVILDDEPAPK